MRNLEFFEKEWGLKMKKLLKKSKKNVFSERKIKKFRRDLEKATEKPFAEFAKARRACWQKAKRIILD